jgi:cathepsin B
MKSFLVICVAAIVGVAMAIVTPELVEEVNNAQDQWVASMDAPTAKMSQAQIMSRLGVPEIQAIWEGRVGDRLPQKEFTRSELRRVPTSFDPREKWPECPTLNDIRDQSGCGSCWAFGAVEFISDRQCIHKKEVTRISAEDMVSCSGGGSCKGGQPSAAMSYWKNTGLVTDVCRPYSLPSCDHHIPGSPNPCNQTYPTPKCIKQCLPSSTAVWAADKHKAKSTYTVSGETQMMAELSTNGPCEGVFMVYDDFLAYTSGIYHHVSGNFVSGHAIKIMGYGEDNGQKYWLVANSWNPHWGEKGFIRFRRGKNECGLESIMYCGLPQ